MTGQKLCFAVSEQFGDDFDEQVRNIAAAGFDGVFFPWHKDSPIERWTASAAAEGLFLQSVHAPFGDSAVMWDEGEEAEEAVRELSECARACARCGAPIMVAHTFIGFYRHEPTAAGIVNYRRVAAAAAEAGVKVAFENTEGEDHLAALMSALRDMDNVGFCWDTGHEMCYNRSADMAGLYGGRLICTHLNDNLGISSPAGAITWHDDLHLLPYDGRADWTAIAARLARTGFTGPLTFELNWAGKPGRHENDRYRRLSFDDYLALAHERAVRFAGEFSAAVDKLSGEKRTA